MTAGSCGGFAGSPRSVMRASGRALKRGEDCTAWQGRGGEGEYNMGRKGRQGEVIYVERDLYLRSRVISWASNEKG